MRLIMATTTTPAGFAAAATHALEGSEKTSFVSRFFEKLIAARMARAEREIQPYLAKMSDERLQDLGFDGPAIEKLPERHYVQAIYWS